MKFKNLQINQRFRFLNDLKIYKKTSNYFASRDLGFSYIYPDQEIKLVSKNETEDYGRIERESLWANRCK